MLCVFLLRLQGGVNLQVCFVNDSNSDKDSDAEDSRTETSLDTPLSPVVRVVSVSSHTLIALTHIGRYIIMSLTLLPHPEQAELLLVRPGHGRGGLGPVR